MGCVLFRQLAMSTGWACDAVQVLAALEALEERYQQVPKASRPHPDIGCWWTLYDYGLEAVKTWPVDYQHPYPGKLDAWRC
jgi:hypothetical protein